MPITSCRIKATNGRFGMANYNRYADRATEASNKEKKSVAIAMTLASTVGLLIRGIPPIDESKVSQPGARGDI